MIEAVLYTAGEAGISLVDLAAIINRNQTATRQQVEQLQARLAADTDTGLQVQVAGDRYYLLTKPDYHEAVARFFAGPPAHGLSQAALEVLAIIAYQQPITRIEIDEIRGVQSSGALTTLASRQLIQEAGRKDVPGRPILYATTATFLDYFGLTSLNALPPITDESGETDLMAQFNQTMATMEDDNGSTD
nr:SMC-Scp complex subunit ScpB [Lacticaseibacillus saniviri]